MHGVGRKIVEHFVPNVHESEVRLSQRRMPCHGAGKDRPRVAQTRLAVDKLDSESGS